MAVKQAKVLSLSQISEAVRLAGKERNGKRNQAIVLLSVRAGLRAAEIAGLTWQMVSDAQGDVGHAIELQLAGHRSIDQTQAYIDGDTQAKRRLVALL